ncbi:hypothetical protein ACFHYO_00480, partial [Paracoccus panacisoli]
ATAATAAGEAARDAAQAGREAASAARSAAEIDRLLTVEGFDLDAVLGLIETSNLDAAQKTSLSTVVRSAARSPSMLGGVLEQVRAVLR